MTESFGKLLIQLLEEIRKSEKEEATKKEQEKCVEMLDRDVTFGIRERICDENECGLTGCPLYVAGECIGNHHLKGVKVKIPARIIDAEAEDKEVKQ